MFRKSFVMVEARAKAFDLHAIQLIAGQGYLSPARRSPDRNRLVGADRTTAASDRSCLRARMPRSACDGVGYELVDPGCRERTRVVEDRGPVVAGPYRTDLAALQTEDVDCVPMDVAPAGGNAKRPRLPEAYGRSTDPLQTSARAVNEADHKDSVMTSHMAGGKLGSVLKARTPARGGNDATKGGPR